MQDIEEQPSNHKNAWFKFEAKEGDKLKVFNMIKQLIKKSYETNGQFDNSNTSCIADIENGTYRVVGTVTAFGSTMTITWDANSGVSDEMLFHWTAIK